MIDSAFLFQFIKKAQSQGCLLGGPETEELFKIPITSDLYQFYSLIGFVIPPNDTLITIISLKEAFEVSLEYNVQNGGILFCQRDVYAESFIFDVKSGAIHSDSGLKKWNDLKEFLGDWDRLSI